MATVVVHGGAGSAATGEQQAGVDRAAERGAARLETGSVVDAVETAVREMETDPAFNAGRGSKLQADGRARPEAAVMTADRSAGAATGLSGVVHPLSVARNVMERTNTVTVAAPFSVELAERWGHEFGTLVTQHRAREWRETFADAPEDPLDLVAWLRDRDAGGGTVGCVAVDDDGDLCAGTSTGGRTNQLRCRVGDTPQVGAGTYCDERVAVSTTGRGESIVATLLARRVAEGHERGRADPVGAALDHFDATVPGVAGVIAVTADGEVGVDHTAEGMASAVVEG